MRSEENYLGNHKLSMLLCKSAWRNLFCLFVCFHSYTPPPSIQLSLQGPTIQPYLCLWFFSFPYLFVVFLTETLRWGIGDTYNELTRASRFVFMIVWRFLVSWGSFGLFCRLCQEETVGPRLDAKFRKCDDTLAMKAEVLW